MRGAVAAVLICLGFVAPANAADATRLSGDLDAKGLEKVVAAAHGKVLLVNFWATWCVPCREEYPDLVRLDKAYRGRGLAVVGISTDFEKELPAVEKFLAAFQPPFPNYRKKSGGDDQVFIEAVDPRWGGELPFSVLYGRDGKRAATLSGKQSLESFQTAVDRLLH